MLPFFKWSSVGTVVLGCVIVVGAVLAILDWKSTLATVAVSIALSATIASIVYLPCFVVFLVRSRSVREGHRAAWNAWKSIFDQALSQMP